VSFSSLVLSLCSMHGRKRPVWSCGVVNWIGRPPISPTPSPGHRQVTCAYCPRTLNSNRVGETSSLSYRHFQQFDVSDET